jgi:hypothetical protein
MAANFDLTNLAVTGLAPGNELIYDNAGMPSIMVKIPKMTYKQLGMGESAAVHPAFIVNGQEVDAIYISKYQNIVQDGRAYSLGGVDPAASLDMDHARQYCEAKGEGWHLMTRMEWGLIQRMCEAAGFVPKGNNNYGRHDSESFYKAIPTYMSGDKIGRVATGTGPLTWYHDNSPSGISGLTGNVWEWMGAVRSVYGEIQFLVNNNGADSAHSQSPTSTEWKAISCVDGSFITPDGKGTTANSVKIDIVGGKLQWAKTITHKNADGDWPSCTFGSITCSADIGANAKLLLQALGMMPYSSSDLCVGHTCWFRNSDEERAFFSGCSWNNPSNGLGSFNGNNPRSNVDDDIGFRAALPPSQILQAQGLALSAEVIKGLVPLVAFRGLKILASQSAFRRYKRTAHAVRRPQGVGFFGKAPTCFRAFCNVRQFV